LPVKNRADHFFFIFSKYFKNESLINFFTLILTWEERKRALKILKFTKALNPLEFLQLLGLFLPASLKPFQASLPSLPALCFSL